MRAILCAVGFTFVACNDPSGARPAASGEVCVAGGAVCGADGVTYADDCARRAAGVGAVHDGACGALASCPSSCEVGASRCLGGRTVQACELVAGCGQWAVPADCEVGCDLAAGRCRPSPARQLDARDCTRRGVCPAGERCIDVSRDRSRCVATCVPGPSARCASGDVCERDGSGSGVCVPRCSDRTCAALGFACEPGSGLCVACGSAGERCCPRERLDGDVAGVCQRGECVEGRCG